MLEGLMDRTPGLEASMVDDVIFGCAMPEGEQGMNVARVIALSAGFPNEVPAMTVNRFCSSGSQTIALAADMVKAGSADVIIAGGVESMSMVEMGGNKLIAFPDLVESNINAYMAMGTTAEVVARRFGITREVQDEFAYNSHRKAAAAVNAGKFVDEIVPLEVRLRENGSWRELVFDTDEGPRADTTELARARFRHRRGTPRRYHGRGPVEAPARFRSHGKRDRRQRLADQRRGSSGRGHDPGTRAGTRPRADRLHPPVGGRRSGSRHHGHRPDQGGAEAARQGRSEAR
jgi:acetyl-CoA acetyltransferase